MLSLAMFEPDIPQNTGSMVRLCACMDVPLHIIEPCGFPLNNKLLHRVAMDYFDHVRLERHMSWQHFLDHKQIQKASRLLLLSTHASHMYTEFAYQPGDILLLGRESAGVPAYVRDAADAYLRIPVQAGVRSLNIVQAASMVLGEALRQTASFPKTRAT
jgi:tRNA (cytidine/uridine-2'-O-)-methyltransferase